MLNVGLEKNLENCRKFKMRENDLSWSNVFFGATWQFHKIWSRGPFRFWTIAFLLIFFLSYSLISYHYSSIPTPNIPHSPQSKEWIAQRSARCQSGGGMMKIHIQIQMIIERKKPKKILTLYYRIYIDTNHLDICGLGKSASDADGWWESLFLIVKRL